jgi:hypothetical protein
MTMDVKEFNTRLKKAVREAPDIRVDTIASCYRFIRQGDALSGYFCPITFVCYSETGRFYNTGDYPLAAQDLGIDEDLADDIVRVADAFPNTGHTTHSSLAILLTLEQIKKELSHV